MRVGEKIKQIRSERKLTLADVEARAGLADGNLSRIERGKQWLTEEKLYAIAKALEVHPAQLFMDGSIATLDGQRDGNKEITQNFSELDPSLQEWISLRSSLGSEDIAEFSRVIKERQARNIKLMEELIEKRGASMVTRKNEPMELIEVKGKQSTSESF